MAANRKIKVVWICSVSNPDLRSHLKLGMPLWHKLFRLLLRKSTEHGAADSAIWNTNALHEFEKIDDVDLHVIFVHSRMMKKEQRFEQRGIHYYAVSDGDNSIISYFKIHFVKGSVPYKQSWKRINSIVKEINPEIIHVMGAENPPYSWSILTFPSSTPIIVQLQTLTHNPAVLKAYPNIHPEYELPVIRRADYIGSPSNLFPGMVRQYIKKDPIFVNTHLLLAEKVNTEQCEKVFDFVYFSNYINKAVDLAIEAFAIAHSHQPSLTLDIIGGASEEELSVLKTRIRELGISDAVTIEGRLATHEDVITQIKKSRIALLPLKSDLISSTIREAMWAGLPVISTITQETPLLNKDRESILLSTIGDHNALADNMLKLVNSHDLEEILRNNGIITTEEIFGNNAEKARGWVEAYRACLAHFHNGTPIPDHIINKY